MKMFGKYLPKSSYGDGVVFFNKPGGSLIPDGALSKLVVLLPVSSKSTPLLQDRYHRVIEWKQGR